MRVICPYTSVKYPHLHLGPSKPLIPQLMRLESGSDAVLGKQQPPLGVLRQPGICPGVMHITTSIA